MVGLFVPLIVGLRTSTQTRSPTHVIDSIQRIEGTHNFSFCIVSAGIAFQFADPCSCFCFTVAIFSQCPCLIEFIF